jgi:glycosyltransferase involved in cell wall biosynthesis
MKMQPTFSIIIPLYNKQFYIERALAAIYAQSKLPHEIILVDDQSTDDSLAIAKAYLGKKQSEEPSVKVAFLQNQINSGPGASRNRGIDCATGEYLFFLDADDEYQSQLFEKAQELIQQRSAELIVFGYKRLPENYNRPIVNGSSDWLEEESEDHFYMREPLSFVYDRGFTLGPGSNAMVSKALLKEVRYDETSYVYEGIDFWFRVVREVNGSGGKCYFLKGPYHHVYTVPDSLIFKPLRLKNIRPPRIIERYRISVQPLEKALFKRVAGAWFNHDLSRLGTWWEKCLFVLKYRQLLPVARENRPQR